MVEDFDGALDDIEYHPARFRIFYKQFRQVQMGIFPYYVYFRIHENLAVAERYLDAILHKAHLTSLHRA